MKNFRALFFSSLRLAENFLTPPLSKVQKSYHKSFGFIKVVTICQKTDSCGILNLINALKFYRF